MRNTLNKLKWPLASVLIGAGAFFAINGLVSDAHAVARDCTTNAVIKCGTLSLNELRDKYNRDATPGTKNIFSGMGISSDIINNYTVHEGVVRGNGDVFIGDKHVAIFAHSAGRYKKVGGELRSHNGTRFYDRHVSLWGVSSWSSFVFTDANGRFVGAVMKSCGNPVRATALQPEPKPEPKPSNPGVSIDKTVQSTTISDDGTNMTTNENWVEHSTVAPQMPFNYQLIVRNTGDVALENVVVTDVAPAGVTFSATDKGTITNNTFTHTIATLGVGESVTIIITAQVASADGVVIKNTACVDAPAIPGDKDDCDDATVDTKKPAPKPEMIEACDTKYNVVREITKEQYDADRDRYTQDLDKCKPKPVVKVVRTEVPREMPKTGVADVLGGIAGVGALTAASYYYITSRRTI